MEALKLKSWKAAALPTAPAQEKNPNLQSHRIIKRRMERLKRKNEL